MPQTNFFSTDQRASEFLQIAYDVKVRIGVLCFSAVRTASVCRLYCVLDGRRPHKPHCEC